MKNLESFRVVVVFILATSGSFAQKKKTDDPKAAIQQRENNPQATEHVVAANETAPPDPNRARTYLYLGGAMRSSKTTYEFDTRRQVSSNVYVTDYVDVIRQGLDAGGIGGLSILTPFSARWILGFDAHLGYYSFAGNRSSATTNGTTTALVTFQQTSFAFGGHPQLGYRFSEHMAVTLGMGARILGQSAAKMDDKPLTPALSSISIIAYGVTSVYLSWGKIAVIPQFRFDQVVGGIYTTVESSYNLRNGKEKSTPVSYMYEISFAIAYQIN